MGQAENEDYDSCKLSDCRKVIQFVNCAVRSMIINYLCRTSSGRQD